MQVGDVLASDLALGEVEALGMRLDLLKTRAESLTSAHRSAVGGGREEHHDPDAAHFMQDMLVSFLSDAFFLSFLGVD